jgi:molybdopterin-guanine dinucleotide biosynthesis protein A
VSLVSGRPDTVEPVYDAIVLAGGTARRLGGVDKPALDVGGSTLLDRALAAAGDARRLVVVGPERSVARAVVWCREEPIGGGPVAAIAAGLPLTSADVVLVLAADLPWVAPAVPVLLSALRPSSDVALLVDSSGRVNHLAAAWHRDALERALAEVGDPDGAAVHALVRTASWVHVLDTGGWGRDCDTWDDLAQARQREGDQL